LLLRLLLPPLSAAFGFGRRRLAAVCKDKFGHRLDVAIADLFLPQPGGMGSGSAQQHQVGAYAFHPSGMAQAADLPVQSVAEIQSADACTGLLQAADQRLLRLPLALDETVWVAVEGQATAHDSLATGGVDLRTEAHEQTKAVE